MRYRIPDLGSGHGKTEEDDRHTGCEGRQSGRMLAWQIQAADAGYSVEKYLTGRCGFTKTQVRRLKFRKHGMQVNGMQVRSTYLLSEGEVLSVCLDDSAAESHEMEASGTVPEILYEDADVIAVWKPAGEVVHPSHGHYQDTLGKPAAVLFSGQGRACDDSKHWPVGCRHSRNPYFCKEPVCSTAALEAARERAVS